MSSLYFSALKNTRSPLRSPPLRNPGESLQQEADDLLNDKAGPYIGLLVFMPAWLIYEWLRYLGIFVITVYAVTVVAAACFLFSLYKVIGYRKKLRNVKRGLLAEKMVGQYLEQFRAALLAS